jgi:transcriptional regulator with XRE-family HTH domain
MSITHKTVRTRLRAWREASGLSLSQAAERLQMSPATLGPVELGRLAPSQAIAARLEAKFGEPVTALLRATPRGVMPRLIEADAETRNAIAE